MAFAEMSLLGETEDAKDLNDGSSSPPPPKKTKMSKLFSFLQTPTRVGPTRNCEEELEAYLSYEAYDHTQCKENNFSALSFWRENVARFPKLSQLARKFLAVPATSAPVKRVFSQAGKILCADRC